MPQVSANFLARHTGKDWKTIKRRIENLPLDKQKRVDSIAALEAIYFGNNGNGEFISTAEAVRRLTIAKEKEIVLDMEIKRGSRIPLEDVRDSANEVFQMFAGTLKANHNKVLTQEVINEIFTGIRDWAHHWKRHAEKAQPCHPTLWKDG